MTRSTPFSMTMNDAGAVWVGGSLVWGARGWGRMYIECSGGGGGGFLGRLFCMRGR